jgi:hypothetical protein
MAKSDLQVLSVSEEEHARKQTQMHNLATNITDQMAKKINSEFGETFTYNKLDLFWENRRIKLCLPRSCYY